MSHEVYRSGYAHKEICYLGYWTPVWNVVADVMLADKWYGKGKIDNDLTDVMRLYIMGQMVCSHLQKAKI